MTVRPDLPVVLTRMPVLAVMRAQNAADYTPAAVVLAEEGILSLELTMTTPGSIEYLATLRKELPDDVEVGIGTIVDADTAMRALDAGADYLVTPTTDATVVRAAAARGAVIVPGGFTPTELHTGWVNGAAAVKLFPASAVGPDYIRQLHGPMPQLRIIPSGGIRLDDATAWLDAGAAAVSVGGPLLGDALDGGDMERLRDRARRLAAAVNGR